MPHGHRTRSQADYEREIEDAAKRMKKYPEHLRSARTSSEWKDFLIDIGVKPEIVNSKSGSDFWKQVREKINPRQQERRTIYQEAKQAGMPARLARQVRDWSESRAREAIEKWQASY